MTEKFTVGRETGLDWAKVDIRFMTSPDVKYLDKATYGCLAAHCGTSDERAVEEELTRKVLAKRVGCSVRALDGSLERLEKTHRVLVIERRTDPNNPALNLPSNYRLIDSHWWDARAAERHARRLKVAQEMRQGGARPAPARRVVQELHEGGAGAARPLVQELHEGGAGDAPPLVQELHEGGAANDTLSFQTSSDLQTSPEMGAGDREGKPADEPGAEPVDADASQQLRRERRLDAVEADLAEMRARGKALEDAAQPTLPVAWPPVRHDPVKGWVRADVEPDPPTAAPVPQQPKRSKYVLLDEGYAPPEALVRKLNQMFPGIDVRYEVSQFVAHHVTAGTRRSNWHQVFEAWCERSAKFARDRAAKGSFQPRRHQPYQEPNRDEVIDLGWI